MPINIRDALLKTSDALPNGATTTVYGTSIDTGDGANGELVARHEFLLTYPALSTTILPDTRTMTYSIVSETTSTLDSSATVEIPSIVVQTGAGGVGAAGGTIRYRTRVGVNRYVGVKVVSGASTTDASATKVTNELLT